MPTRAIVHRSELAYTQILPALEAYEPHKTCKLKCHETCKLKLETNLRYIHGWLPSFLATSFETVSEAKVITHGFTTSLRSSAASLPFLGPRLMRGVALGLMYVALRFVGTFDWPRVRDSPNLLMKFRVGEKLNKLCRGRDDSVAHVISPIRR